MYKIAPTTSAAPTDPYSESLKAARAYDGSEETYQSFFTIAQSFEACTKELALPAGLDRDARERAAAQQLNPHEESLSIQQLMELASRSFANRLRNGKVNLNTISTEFEFIPPDSTASPVVTGNGSGFDGAIIEPRKDALIEALVTSGIHTDYIRMIEGKVPHKNSLRKTPYYLMQIPHLNREILICDQVGNACFWGAGLRGPLFWSTYHKYDLQRQPDVWRYEHRGSDWAQKLVVDILHNTMPATPVKLRNHSYGYALSEDLILIKALEYAAQHEGKLPTNKIGPVDGLPGLNWGSWSQSLRHRRNGLTRKGVRGLGHFFQIYGMKMGPKENPDILAKALQSLKATGQHGLVVGEAFKLSEDLILIKALEYAAQHEGKLPTDEGGPVDGVPGQNWKNWHAALQNRSNGLTREGVGGLGDFFQIYRLKNGRKENPDILAKTLQSLKATGQHGLVVGEAFKLSEDLILIKALEYAVQQEGKLPTQKRGPVDGVPGLNWNNLNDALRNRSNGLTREGVGGLTHFFQIYGLKNGKKENPDIIALAINNMQEGKGHGLQPLPEMVAALRPKAQKRSLINSAPVI